MKTLFEMFTPKTTNTINAIVVTTCQNWHNEEVQHLKEEYDSIEINDYKSQNYFCVCFFGSKIIKGYSYNSIRAVFILSVDNI